MSAEGNGTAVQVWRARSALRAWRAQPRSVRRKVVALSRRGLAADPVLARLAVDWARGEYPLSYLPGLIFSVLAVSVVASRQFGQSGSNFGAMDIATVVITVVAVGYFIGALSRYRRARDTARVNLHGLLDLHGYAVQDAIDVRATRLPRWIVPGYSVLFVLFLGTYVGGSAHRFGDVGAAVASAVCPLVWVGAFYLSWRQRQSELAGRRPRAGSPMLGIGPDGLAVAHLGRVVAWSEVTAADVAPARTGSAIPLAIRFTLRDQQPVRLGSLALRDPDHTLIYPVHWLDQDPGVILATARFFMAANQ
jgi:hypothetical protein